MAVSTTSTRVSVPYGTPQERSRTLFLTAAILPTDYILRHSYCRHRKWTPSAGSPAALPMTSTICLPLSPATPSLHSTLWYREALRRRGFRRFFPPHVALLS